MIRGGSAGGFTTLAALAFTDTFAAGASQFGVADLELLARDTHKFESRYLDGLVGPWPEAAANTSGAPRSTTSRHLLAADPLPGLEDPWYRRLSPSSCTRPSRPGASRSPT